MSELKVSNRNPIISLSRVLGMVFIVLCHIIPFYTFIPGSEFLGQFFICGVQLFIFISGYLYGGKKMRNFGVWYLKRFFTVSFPSIILSVIVIIVLFFCGIQTSIPSIIAYCLDLEGLLFLNNSLSSWLFKSVTSLNPLWFTTVIMLCYLCVPLLQKVVFLNQRKQTFFLIAFILIGTAISAVSISVFAIQYFLFFAIGYFAGRIRILDKVNLLFVIVYSVLFVLAVLGRVFLHRYFDSSQLYISFVELSKFLIGTWFVVALAFLHNIAPSIITKISEWKIISVFEKYSFYIYLVHGIFCMGVFNLYDCLPLWLATVLFLLLTGLSAFILKIISSFLTKLFIK